MPTSRALRYLGWAVLIAVFGIASGWASAAAQQSDSGQIAEGARLYAENCAVCHGPQGEGRVGATLAKNWPSVRPDLTVKTIIENGVPGSVMPAWSQKNGGPLSQDQIDAIAAFILTWQTGSAINVPPLPTYTPHPPIEPVPNVEGDPNQGASLYAENCAVCHGASGQGRIGATLVKEWPSVRPDLTIKSTIQTGIQGSLMPAWSQKYGGPLSENNINDLVAYILSLPPSSVVQVEPTSSLPAATTAPWLEGWAGVLLFVGIFALLIAGSLWLQRRGG